MFRSLVTFIAVILFAFVVVLLWSGSQELTFKRVAMDGDRSTQAVIADFQRKQMEAAMASSAPTETTQMEAPKASSSGDGPPVVVWISIPGFRGDYVEKSETPFFDELISKGGGTNKMRPSFPCLTFPAHATMATGVPASTHGIVADQLRTAPGEVISEPTDSALLEAEPIWTSATRQGIKTLVHDWPLSQNQSGDHPAAYFLESFDAEANDATRLNTALEAWRGSVSEGTEPAADGSDHLRLVMLRLNDIYKAGLTHGPRSDDTYAVIGETDKALKAFFDTVQSEWETLAPPAANLVVFITTDHGMAELDKNVNIAQLLGEEMMANADIVAHDAIANLYFKDLPESEGEKQIFTDKFDGELSKRIYFRTIKKEEIPEEWSYAHERTGDRVLVLKTGYAFAEETSDEPVFDPSEGPGYFGSYGYPVEESIRMSGQVILGGIPNSPLNGELGEISQLTFHATVSKILGIEPAEGASTETLDVK
ncbi:MAG: alkaline phosphatase family protein [Verrucomicrobiales bacterium]|nr:alkaline phosphatase family protein [Verrucomicrobiales bacterium]